VRRHSNPASPIPPWFSAWATSHGTEFLSTGPMSWSFEPMEREALLRCRSRFLDNEVLLRRYTEKLFGTAHDLFYDTVERLELFYERHPLPTYSGPAIAAMEADCVEQWTGGDLDRLCLLPLSWSPFDTFERFLRFDVSVEQLNTTLTKALYERLGENRRLLSEALLDLEAGTLAPVTTPEIPETVH
jgi:hypothetical protein